MPSVPSAEAPSKPAGPSGSLCCDALVRLLGAAELEYRAAILEANKAEGGGFYEHNVASYKKGIRDTYRNLLKPNAKISHAEKKT
jgi:hypothetical protein